MIATTNTESLAASVEEGAEACKVLTIGHSTRSIDEFVSLLSAHGVTQLVDVRTVPRSRHNPQFNAWRGELRDRRREALAGASADSFRQGSGCVDHLSVDRLMIPLIDVEELSS